MKEYTITISQSDLNKLIAGLHTRLYDYGNRMTTCAGKDQDEYERLKAIRSEYKKLYDRLGKI